MPRATRTKTDKAEDVQDAPTPSTAPLIPPVPKTTKTPGVQFATLGDEKEYGRFLFYGREGSGKTTAALRASRNGRVLVINAEAGLKKRALESMGVEVSNVAMLNNVPGGRMTHDDIEAAFWQVKSDLATDPDSWYAVVFDSATDIINGFVEIASDDRVNKARNRGVHIDSVDSFFTDRGDYGTAAKMFRDLLRKFRTLPCHLVITALERRDVDEDTSLVQYGPAVPPALSVDLRGYMDEVYAFKAADDRKPFRALTRGVPKYYCKNRSKTMPKVLDDPFFDVIIDLVDHGDIVVDEPPTEDVKPENTNEN